jgi:hypothetical protein
MYALLFHAARLFPGPDVPRGERPKRVAIHDRVPALIPRLDLEEIEAKRYQDISVMLAYCTTLIL